MGAGAPQANLLSNPRCLFVPLLLGSKAGLRLRELGLLVPVVLCAQSWGSGPHAQLGEVENGQLALCGQSYARVLPHPARCWACASRVRLSLLCLLVKGQRYLR